MRVTPRTRGQQREVPPTCRRLRGLRRRLQRRKFRTRFRDQTFGRGLDFVLQALLERGRVKPRRNRIEYFDHHRPRIADGFPARPEQSGVEGNRHAGNTELGVEPGDAELVRRLRSRSPAGAFREDHDLAAPPQHRPCGLDHSRDGLDARAAIDRHHVTLPGVPAEKRNPHQFALDDEAWMIKQGNECERLPYRLVFGGDEDSARWNLVKPAIFDPQVADHAQPPEAGPPPGLGEPEDGAARHQQRRQRRQ
jgi:hypothetical protein